MGKKAKTKRMKSKVTKTTTLAQKGVLLSYQIAWITDQAKVKVIEKSRRIGISWAEAADDALFAAIKSGNDVWYIGYNKEMALEFISDVADWAKLFNEAASEMEEVVINDEKKDILSYRIRFASGHRVTALSSRPTNLRGKKGRVVIDEAAFHDNMDGLIKAALAFLIWGGQVRIISTHFGEDNPFNELVEEIRAGKKPFSLHRVTLDEALAQGLYRQISKKTGQPWSPASEAAWRNELIQFYGDDADEELHVIPSGGSGVYLSRALIKRCMDEDIPVLRWRCKDDFAQQPEQIRELAASGWCHEYLDPVLNKIDPNRPLYFGEDFGRTGDLTVILPLLEGQTLHYRAPCVIELRNVPFQQQKQILFYFLDRIKRFRGGAMDARGNGQYLAEVAAQRYGEGRILQVQISQLWYREAMPKYKAAFEDESITIPLDSDILADNRLIRMDKGIAKVPDNSRTKGADGGQRHGDSAIAGAMAIYAIETCPGGETEYQSIGKRHFSKRGAW